MQRLITRVSVLLFASMLVSCGGGGDDGASGGGTTVSADGGTPAGSGGIPPPADGGTQAPADGGGTPVPADGGGTPAPADGGSPPAPTDGGTAPPPAGGGTIPSAGVHVEETDPSVTFSAGWSGSSPLHSWTSGTVRRSTTAHATVSFRFNGTSVRWIGSRAREGGKALVSVDGGPTREVDLFSRAREVRTPIVTIYDLSPGEHTLTIEVTGQKHKDATSNLVVVDAFEVEPPIVSRLQETEPNPNDEARALGQSDILFSGAWVQDASLPYSSCCVTEPGENVAGGARVAEGAGSMVTLTFRGTGIRWIGYRGPNAGIARVRVDGGDPTVVDLYSVKQQIQEPVFTATGLADTTHTLTIEATGEKSDASTGTRVVVDAFDLLTPGKRYEEGDPAIVYTRTWNPDNRNKAWSEGGAATTTSLGATATFSFTGTSVSWIGCEKSNIGRAKIYIDDVLQAEVDMREAFPIEGFQHTIFRKDGLASGPHKLKIETTSTGAVVVDAFDVRP